MQEENPFNLSETSLAVLKWLVEQDTSGQGVVIPARSIGQQFSLGKTETEDVVHELESNTLVSINTPISGATVETTHQAVMALAGNLPFNPSTDVTELAKALCDNKTSMTGKQLQDATSLETRPVNFAARYIEGEGLAEVQHALGASEFSFTQMVPTYETRKHIGIAK